MTDVTEASAARADEQYQLPEEPRVPVVDANDMQGWTGRDAADLEFQSNRRRALGPDGQSTQTDKFAKERLKGLLIDALRDHVGLEGEAISISNGITHGDSLRFEITFESAQGPTEVQELVGTLDGKTPNYWAFKFQGEKKVTVEIHVCFGLRESSGTLGEPNIPSRVALEHQAKVSREMAEAWLRRAEELDVMLEERDEADEENERLMDRAEEYVKAEILRIWPDLTEKASLLNPQSHINEDPPNPCAVVQCEVVSRGTEDYRDNIIEAWNNSRPTVQWTHAEKTDKGIRFFVPRTALEES